MKRTLLLALSGLLVLILSSCNTGGPAGPPRDAPEPFPFTTVYEGCDGTYVGGGLGGSGFSSCTVFHSQEELDAFWTFRWSDPVPQVDFDQAWVFAIYRIYCGACCVGGTWEVQSAEETHDCIRVEIQKVGCSTVECNGPASCACIVLVTIPQADKPFCLNESGPGTCPYLSSFSSPKSETALSLEN